MTDRSTIKREYRLVTEDGHRLFVTAKRHSFREQHPYFSVTSQRGANHEAILAACPALAPVVAMHLHDEDGVPMHAVANLAYHLGHGDVGEAYDHMAGAIDMETLRSATAKAKGDATAATSEARRLVEQAKPLWKEMAREAVAEMDGPTFVADGWIEPEDDPTTFIGFMKDRGVAFAATPRGAAHNSPDGFPEGSTSWTCRFTMAGRRLTAPFHLGPAHGGREPEATEVLECIRDDARAGALSFDEFKRELGYDGSEGKRVWNACVQMREKMEAFFGSDFDFLMNEVERDGPIFGGRRDDETPGPA